MLLQVGRQGIDTHAVDTRRTFVALHLRQRFLQVLTLDNCFHRRSRDHRAFETGSRRARFGLSGGGASGFTLRSGAQVQLDLILLPHGSHEITALLASSSVQAFGGALPPTTPSADFCAAVRSPYDGLSPQTGTQRRPPEVRPTAFPARPPDLPPRPLMTVDFAITCSLVRPGRPRYPVFVHRAAALLHAFFRPHLAMTPLRFANPSPPSGWIEDFHLQAVVRTRHTTGCPAFAGHDSRRVRKRKGGHGALAPLPTLRIQRKTYAARTLARKPSTALRSAPDWLSSSRALVST